MSIRNIFRSLSLRSGSTRSSSSSSRPSVSSVFSRSSAQTTGTSISSGSGCKTMAVSGATEFEEVSFNECKDILVMASLKAPLFEANRDEKRAPIDICCVIDQSGSMSGAKIALARKAVEFVVDNLEAEDTLSIVVYDDDASTLMPFTKMNTSGKNDAKKKIELIQPRGSTALAAGLFLGLELAHKRSSKNDICSVLLLTDGQANIGFSDTASITAEMERRLASHTKKPSVFTFGFGSDHNQDMLRGIAETGAGMYYYLADADKIPLSFADCLGGLQSVVGQNLTLEVAGAEGAEGGGGGGVQIVKSLNSKYKISKGSPPLPGKSITLELGDIYSEEGRDLIFLVNLPKLAAQVEGETECVKFRLSYFNVISVQDEVTEIVVMIRRPETAQNQKANPQLDQQRNRLEAAEAMEKSKQLADKGDLTGAKSVLQKAKECIQDSTTANEKFCSNLMTELDQCFDDMRDTQTYMSEGNKKIARKAQAHYYQRSNKLEDSEIGFYETSAKAAYKSKSKGFF